MILTQAVKTLDKETAKKIIQNARHRMEQQNLQRVVTILTNGAGPTRIHPHWATSPLQSASLLASTIRSRLLRNLEHIGMSHIRRILDMATPNHRIWQHKTPLEPRTRMIAQSMEALKQRLTALEYLLDVYNSVVATCQLTVQKSDFLINDKSSSDRDTTLTTIHDNNNDYDGGSATQIHRDPTTALGHEHDSGSKFCSSKGIDRSSSGKSLKLNFSQLLENSNPDTIILSCTKNRILQLEEEIGEIKRHLHLSELSLQIIGDEKYIKGSLHPNTLSQGDLALLTPTQCAALPSPAGALRGILLRIKGPKRGNRCEVWQRAAGRISTNSVKYVVSEEAKLQIPSKMGTFGLTVRIVYSTRDRLISERNPLSLACRKSPLRLHQC